MNGIIPYGYKIEMGKAVIVEEEAEKVREFFSLYLAGYAVSKAIKEAQIPRSVFSGRMMLHRELYAGDDYYPAIVDEATFQAAHEEQEKRRARQKKHNEVQPKKAVPVKKRFILMESEENAPEDAAERLAYLYSLIIPSEDGDEVISLADRAILNQCIKG